MPENEEWMVHVIDRRTKEIVQCVGPKMLYREAQRLKSILEKDRSRRSFKVELAMDCECECVVA